MIKNFFNAFFHTLFFLPTDKRKRIFNNKLYGFLSKPLNDIITMIIYFGVIILCVLALDRLFIKADFFMFNIDSIFKMTCSTKKTYSFLIYIYSFRIWPMILFTIIYFVSKLIRTTMVRGNLGAYRNKMNVQITPFIVYPIHLCIKLFIEYLCINGLAYILTINDENILIKLFDDLFLKQMFHQNEFYYLAVLSCCYMAVVIVFTMPLSIAQYIAPDIEGNYKFTFFGRAVYVGNAEDGIASRLTKYYNNRGAVDTGKIYYIRFFLRVNFYITGSMCKFVEDAMYICYGCPLINCKDTWGHIR